MAKEYVEQVYINHSEKLYDIRDAEAEHVDSRVNTIRQAPDNEHYPSEKAVADALVPKENLSNKTASWNTVPSDTRYPTEKLVKDTFDALESELEADNGKYALAQFEKLSNKTTEWSATVGDTKYPTEKLVKESIDKISTVVVDELPDVNVASTTVNYVLKSGDGALLYKKIGSGWRLVGGSKVKVLAELPETGDSFTDFYIPNGTTGRYTHYRWLDEDGAFHAVGVDAYSKAEADLIFATKENLENKVSAWSETTSDDHYPTEKLVKDTIEDLRDDAEHKSNKITAWSAEASDTKYPSEKLVKGALSDLSQDIESIDVITTHVVSELPAISEAIPDHDYVLLKGSGALHYKVINGEWKMVGGAMVRVVDTLPETGDSNTDYYMAAEGADNVYLHYRWMDGSGTSEGHYYAVGSDAYSKTEIDFKLSEINNNLAQSVNNINGAIGGHSTLIGEINSKIEELEQKGRHYTQTLVQDENNDYWLHLNEFEGESDEPSSVFKTKLPATGGGSGGPSALSNLTVERLTGSPISVTPTDNVIVQANIYSEDDAHVPISCSYTMRLGTTTVLSGVAVPGLNTFDLTPFCRVGTLRFTLTVTDELGSMDMKFWTVQVIDVRLESSFNDRYSNPVGNAVNFPYTPTGATQKVVHFKLDGRLIDEVSIPSSTSGMQQSYDIAPQSHGSHLLEVWMTAELNGLNLETQHIYKDIIWYDESNDDPIIACIYRNDYYGKVTCKQYDALSIPYVVIDPRTASPEVELYVDGVLVSKENLTTSANTWVFKSGDTGTHTLMISRRNKSVQIVVEVEEIDYEIKPVTAGIAFDFNPVGLTNASADRLWVDSNNPAVKMTVSDNFDWSNGGYQSDAEGNQYFCVKSGTRAYFSYNLFGTNPMQTGSHFKVIFKTEAVRDKDASFLSCLESTTRTVHDEETGEDKEVVTTVGLEMQAHEANVHTSTGALFLPYSEDDIIEYEYTVNPLDLEDDSATSYILTFEDGVAARPLIYNASCRLYQYNPVPITVGSDDCDVLIYRMKAFSAALTDKDVLTNFIADARDAETMVARYERNQIYDENGALDPDRLATFCPDLKIIKITCPHFTNDKADYVKDTTVECIHVNGDPDRDNWTFTNGYHAGQGTTSNEYGFAGRNIDIIFGFDGEHQVVSKIPFDPNYITTLSLGKTNPKTLTGLDAKVQLTATSVPNTWFNIKVNIASSENANNALLQKRYNDYLPEGAKTPAMRRSTEDMIFKNSMEFVNCVVFLREIGPEGTHREFQDNEWHFYAIGNIGDSKKTDNTRVNDPTDMREFVVEISDNTLPNSTFDTGVRNRDNTIKWPITRAEWSGTNGYIEVTDPDLLNSKNLGLFYEKQGNNYVKTTDTEIDADKTYYEVNYVNPKYKSLYIDQFQYDAKKGKYKAISGWDASFEFRYDMGTKDGESISDAELEAQQERSKQVFRDMYEFIIMSSNEEFVSHFGDWFLTKSPLFWYLFTERWTMIDNRAKNTFWHYGKTYITQAEKEDLGEEKSKGYIVDDAAAAINDGYRFDLWDYDNDTAIGINNSGELTLSYGYEDTDRRADGGTVFNAADSVFWARIRALMSDQLAALYLELDSTNCWNADDVISEFDRWQEQFPEALWREDVIRKYIRTYKAGTPRFFNQMMNGRKKYQRRQFERNQDPYIGSKYLSTRFTSDQIMFRCNTPSGVVVDPDYTLRIVPYSDMYVSVKYGNTSTQQRRAKAGELVEITTNLTFMDDTAILIYLASRIQALNDISACYIHDNDFSKASRLKNLKIGSDVAGYSNRFLTELNIGNNTLLETLDVRNCPNLNGSVSLIRCPNLRELYLEGTAVSSVIFATYGKIKIAHLPATINSLFMRNLNYLTDLELAATGGLEQLTSEYGIYNPYDLVVASIDHLQELTLSGIDWVLPNANLLNKIYAMSTSVLRGVVTITSTIRSIEIEMFNAKWKDLHLNTEGATVIYPYVVTYKNWNGDVLYTSYVDPNSYPNDPVADGLIDAPTRPADQQFTYTYAGWDGIDTRVNSNTEVTAKYSTAVRTYSVRWFAFDGDMSPLYTKNVQYGAEAVYEGAYPSEGDIDAGERHRIFVGWDKSTGCIKGDTNVIAKWEYAYASATGDLNTLSAAEIYAISAEQPRNRFETKDYFELPLGWDFTFNTIAPSSPGYVDSRVLLEDRFFDGVSDYEDTDIELITADYPAFTLAIDYEFCADCDDKAIIASCFSDSDATGFRLLYNASANDPGSATSALRWTGSTSAAGERIGKSSQRNIVVLRHQAKSEFLYIYSFNGASNSNDNLRLYDPTITMKQLRHSKAPTASSKLTFGAIRNDSGTRHFNYAKGWIHWAKVWFDDLGDDACKKLASWPHEKLRMEIDGTIKHQLATSNVETAYASFFSNSSLPLMTRYGDGTATTWETSIIRTFCQERLYPAIDYRWKSVIKPVVIITAKGANSSRDYEPTTDYLYIPAYANVAELSQNSNSQYAGEDSFSTIFSTTGPTASLVRYRWAGVIAEERDFGNLVPGRRFYTGDDPDASGYACDDGDIWFNSARAPYYYMYFSAETLSKHSMIGTIYSWANADTYGWIPTINGGAWVRSEGWWTRSPHETQSGSFMMKQASPGYTSNNFTSSSQTNYAGILVCLSI